MNVWIISGIIACALIIGGIAMGNFATAETTKEVQSKVSCSSCGNACTAENNCGLSTCGAVNGGKCGCKR